MYLPELLLWATFLLWGFHEWDDLRGFLKKIQSKVWLLLALFLLNAVVLSFLKGHPAFALFFVLHFVEAFMIYLLWTSNVLPTKKSVQMLLYGALFQLFLSLLQRGLNHSIGLNWLGEQVIGPQVDNVAKVDLMGDEKQIRPYGTFLHPNILAAYLMTVLFILLPFVKKSGRVFWIVLLTGGIYLTGSRAAMIATLLGFGMIVLTTGMSHVKSKGFLLQAVAALLLIANVWVFQMSAGMRTDDDSWGMRLEQNTIAKEMLYENPLGVGPANFTLEMENYTDKKLKPWDFQPVHNVWYLVVTELGLQGLLMLFFALFWLFKSVTKDPDILSMMPLIGLVLIASFDHFLWDSFVGWVLVALAVGALMHKKAVPKRKLL